MDNHSGPRAAYECLVHVRALLMMPRAREEGTGEEMRNALFGKRVGQSKLVIRVCARATAARNFQLRSLRRARTTHGIEHEPRSGRGHGAGPRTTAARSDGGGCDERAFRQVQASIRAADDHEHVGFDAARVPTRGSLCAAVQELQPNSAAVVRKSRVR